MLKANIELLIFFSLFHLFWLTILAIVEVLNIILEIGKAKNR